MTATTTSFGWPEQLKFAELSGDYNPIHLDEIVARRLIFGDVVVHGVHILLRALEWIASERDTQLVMRSVTAQFQHPVLVGGEAAFRVLDSGSDRNDTLVEVRVGTGVVAKIRFTWASGQIGPGDPAPHVPDEEVCLHLTADELPAARGQVPITLGDDLLAEMFPALSRNAQRGQLATLLATTRIVGMKCPGHNSLFSELAVSFFTTTEDNGSLEFVVDRYDSRFHLASLNVRGAGTEGVLKAFLRPPAQDQPTTAELAQFVSAGEFLGKRALVIGGSRGLGELCAKLLAAGGADVRLTYRRGERDAAAVVRDIEASGGSATGLRFDVLDGGSVLLEALGEWQPTDLLYLATPPIFRPRQERFSSALYDEFSDVYVKSFADVFSSLAPLNTLQYVKYPSTVAIGDLTRDVPEYLVAKSAAEVLCRFFAKVHNDICFDVTRLPRLATDQTANVYGVAAEDPVPVLLAWLRSAEENV